MQLLPLHPPSYATGSGKENTQGFQLKNLDFSIVQFKPHHASFFHSGPSSWHHHNNVRHSDAVFVFSSNMCGWEALSSERTSVLLSELNAMATTHRQYKPSGI